MQWSAISVSRSGCRFHAGGPTSRRRHLDGHADLQREHHLLAQVTAASMVVLRSSRRVERAVGHVHPKQEELELGPILKLSKPSPAMRSAALSTCRSSASYGSPSGCGCRRTSAPMRARRLPATTGRPAPGIAIMSDSSIALKPVTDDPSKPIPVLKGGCQLVTRDREALEPPDQIGEPQPHELTPPRRPGQQPAGAAWATPPWWCRSSPSCPRRLRVDKTA